MLRECQICGAPAPVAGDVEHAWDCPRSPYPKRFRDWDIPVTRLNPIEDVTFVALPPLAALPDEERAALAVLARFVWCKVAASEG